MGKYKVTLIARETVLVEAKDEYDAEKKAINQGWRLDAEWEVEDVENEDVVEGRCCENCKNCRDIDADTGRITCRIDNVPNCHSKEDLCCLYEDSEL